MKGDDAIVALLRARPGKACAVRWRRADLNCRVRPSVVCIVNRSGGSTVPPLWIGAWARNGFGRRARSAVAAQSGRRGRRGSSVSGWTRLTVGGRFTRAAHSSPAERGARRACSVRRPERAKAMPPSWSFSARRSQPARTRRFRWLRQERGRCCLSSRGQALRPSRSPRSAGPSGSQIHSSIDIAGRSRIGGLLTDPSTAQISITQIDRIIIAQKGLAAGDRVGKVTPASRSGQGCWARDIAR